MPKIKMIEVAQDRLKKVFSDIGASRGEMATKLEVSIETIKKWLTNGRLPQKDWETIDRLRKEAVQAKMVELFPIESALHLHLSQGKIYLMLQYELNIIKTLGSHLGWGKRHFLFLSFRPKY